MIARSHLNFFSQKITQKICLISHVRFFKKCFHENLHKKNIRNVMQLSIKMQLIVFYHLSRKKMKKTFRKIEFSSKFCFRPKFQKTRIKNQISIFFPFLVIRCLSDDSFAFFKCSITISFVYRCFF